MRAMLVLQLSAARRSLPPQSTVGPGSMSDLCVTRSLFCKPRDPRSPHPTLLGRAELEAEVHGMARKQREKILQDPQRVRSLPILPSVTINLGQSTVVQQTVLSFDRRRGNLKKHSLPISPRRSRASSAAPPFRVLWRRAQYLASATNEKFGSQSTSTSAVRQVSSLTNFLGVPLDFDIDDHGDELLSILPQF